ncbi:MAG: YlxR family protein [Ruminococcaceae bacterium]|nr:YlxR family protein [Oscillospiraceae bacterium]
MATTKPKQGSEKIRKVPQRRCVGCSGTFDKKDLLRIVRTPAEKDENGDVLSAGSADRICIDFTGKKSGRGAYICKKEECLAKARKTGRLKSSLECEITDAVYDELAKEIRLDEAGSQS